MKYKKDTFIVIPNKDSLEGTPSEMQAIYFWLCNYANKDGECFPARATLARQAGCNIKTVDKYLLKLEDCGFIKKTERYSDDGKSQKSNLYEILIRDTGGNVVLSPSTENGTQGGTKNGSLTQSNKNSIQLTQVLEHGQLSANRGKTYILRVLSVYRDLFRQKYGFEPQVDMGRFGKSLKNLMQTKTELQVSALLVTFFNWNGMTGNDTQEAEKLLKATYNINWFFSMVTTYEVYLRNVQRLEFDDEAKVKEFLINYFSKQ